jgi:hypothetical protein
MTLKTRLNKLEVRKNKQPPPHVIRVIGELTPEAIFTARLNADVPDNVLDDDIFIINRVFVKPHERH